MGTTANADRRDPTAPRRAIRATVDLTPDNDREVWQADAIDLSLGGMSMRGSTLPEIGEQLALAFKPEGDSTVAARGEVVWALEKGPNAGAFGVRFTDVPPTVEQSLRRMLDQKDDVIAPEVRLPSPDARVKLFIHGMDAPLRARVRSAATGEMIVGSDLSFLKLGDKVDVDGGNGSKVTGVIDSVDVEVDAKTRVPRLVLSIDLGGKKKKTRAEIGTAPTVLAASPRPSEPELPTARASVAREPAKPVKTAHLEDVPVELSKKPERAVKPRTTQVPEALASDHTHAETSAGDADTSFNDEPAPGWLTQGMRSVRGAAARVGESAGPVMRRAFDAALGLKERIARRNKAEMSDSGDEETSSRKGLRPQHPEASDPGDAIVTSPGKRNRKVGLYAVVGLVLAAGIVAYASSSGPKVETPHPQVAVAPETGAADPNAPAADPNASGEPVAAADPSTQSEPAGEPSGQQAEPRLLNGSNPRAADLAAAAGAANAQGEGEAPIIQTAPQRVARYLPPALARQGAMGAQPAAQRVMQQPAQRLAAQQRVVQQPMQQRVMQPPMQQRVMQQPAQSVSVAQAPARPAVFGNPAVRTGTVLRLHMDGPVAAIQGVGARGAQIVLNIPGRRSLDMAAPFVSQDPRIAGAGVLNGAAGASLTLRFREAAPPFVARSRGNMLEIVLAPTPGTAPMRASVRAPLVIGQRAVR